MHSYGANDRLSLCTMLNDLDAFRNPFTTTVEFREKKSMQIPTYFIFFTTSPTTKRLQQQTAHTNNDDDDRGDR